MKYLKYCLIAICLLLSGCTINHHHHYIQKSKLDSLILEEVVIPIWGDYIETGNELHLAIRGEGFFELIKNDGTLAYTRFGKFYRDSNGRICDENGYQLNGSPTIDTNAENITICQDGQVLVTVNGETTNAGSITLGYFKNPEKLNYSPKGFVIVNEESGTVYNNYPGEGSLGTLIQGSLEKERKLTIIKVAESY